MVKLTFKCNEPCQNESDLKYVSLKLQQKAQLIVSVMPMSQRF